MKAGGNAIDASVATAFALAVTHPQAGNIGGGGFIVLHTNKGVNSTIDFREKARLSVVGSCEPKNTKRSFISSYDFVIGVARLPFDDRL